MFEYDEYDKIDLELKESGKAIIYGTEGLAYLNMEILAIKYPEPEYSIELDDNGDIAISLIK